VSVAVWAVDDGTRIRPEDTDPTEQRDNGIYRPGEGIRLFGVTGETVAWQVVLDADDRDLASVTVDVSSPRRADGHELFGRDERPPLGIEKFVPYPLPVTTRTRSRSEETIGWLSNAARPSDSDIAGNLPDPLIPVPLAPGWAPYPLFVARHRRGALWIDLTIPDDAASGRYQATVSVAAGTERLGELPLEIEVKQAHLPWRAATAVVYYDHRELEERIGGAAAEALLVQLFRRHHVTPLLSADDEEDLDRIRPLLQDAEPGENVVALGAYGSLGEPSASKAARALGMAQSMAETTRARPEVFVYAIDEQCDSDRAARWRRLLGASLPVGETCGERITERASDIVMVAAEDYAASVAADARNQGKQVWIYNGKRPRSGSLVLDAPAVDLRANGWIAAAYAVHRWFYWESTFWNDDNRGGHGPVDVYASSETFHNDRGETGVGDGVLVYPGRQVSFPVHSLGYDGVIPSVRLKNIRRGIEDAAYVALAAVHDPVATERIVRNVVPAALDELESGDRPPAWSARAEPFERARRALWELIPDGSSGVDERQARPALDGLAARRSARRNDTRTTPEDAFGGHPSLLAAALAAAWFLARRRARRLGRAKATQLSA
jgi:Domain of unknown function (DUF4091)